MQREVRRKTGSDGEHGGFHDVEGPSGGDEDGDSYRYDEQDGDDTVQAENDVEGCGENDNKRHCNGDP